MAEVNLTDVVSLGRIRWTGSNALLMGRALWVNSPIQVQVKNPSSGGSQRASDVVWIDAVVDSIAEDQVVLRTSFARFIAEPELPCRWPPNAPPLTRRELEQVFSDSVGDVSDELAGLVRSFQDDPLLRQSPFERLLAYSNAVTESANKVQAIARLIENVAQQLTSRVERSKLVV